MDIGRRHVVSHLGKLRSALCMCSLIFFFILFADESSGAVENKIPLEGEYAFTATQDDPAFLVPDYDDSHWQRVDVPGSWAEVGVSGTADVGTYRIRFRVPDDWQVERPAALLGLISRADETYLNGTKIGGEGIVGSLGSVWFDSPPIIPRLYPFDRKLVNVEGDNILTIRVARFPFLDEGGLFSGPVAIVDYADALPAVSAQGQRFASIDNFIFGIESLILMVALAAFGLGIRDRVMTAFLLTYISYFLTAVRDLYFLHDFGMRHELITFLTAKVGGLIWIPLIEFVAGVFNRPVGRIGRFLQLCTLIVVASFPAGNGHPMTIWYIWSGLMWSLIMICVFVLLCFWAIEAVMKHKSNGIPLLIGLSLMGVLLILDMVLSVDFTVRETGQQIGSFGITVFLLSLAAVVALRMFETEKALQQANSNALDAHEQERSRLARDIHDGIGQWLSAIKLNLQMLKSEVARNNATSIDRVEELVSDVSHAIEDTRRIAHDLAPAFLEQHGLVAAMLSHADRLNIETNIDIIVDAPTQIDLPDKTRNHLYRVFQEAVRNAIEHSGGSKVRVSLVASHGNLTLSVEDNGSGLRSKGNRKTSDHLGIQSMTERAKLLGGYLETFTRSGQGTSIVVTVPIG